MTLAARIDRYEARQVAIPQTTLTTKGAAVQTAIKLRRLLAQLDSADRSAVLDMLAESQPIPA